MQHDANEIERGRVSGCNAGPTSKCEFSDVPEESLAEALNTTLYLLVELESFLTIW